MSIRISIPVIVLWPFKCVTNNYVGYCYALNHTHVCIIFLQMRNKKLLQIPARMWYCSIIYLFVLLLIRLWLRANCIYPELHIRNALPESTLARLILLVNLDEAGVYYSWL